MPRRSSALRFVLPLVGSLGVAALVGCGPGTSRIEVADAVVPVPATADTAAIYLRITNDGDADDRLLKVSTPRAELTTLHKTTVDPDGRATMAGVGSVKIPAGETVSLSPGGLHLMMLQPDRLAAGDTVDLTLTFEQAGTVTVPATVTDDIDDVVGRG